jgi:hypothetical protein
MTSTPDITLTYDGPLADAEAAVHRARALGLAVVVLDVDAGRSSFAAVVPRPVSWVQALGLAEVLAYTQSPPEPVVTAERVLQRS